MKNLSLSILVVGLVGCGSDVDLSSLGSESGTGVGTISGKSCTADINSDMKVDHTDYGIMKTSWNTSGKSFSEGDINGDGNVDIDDFAILAPKMGSNCSITCKGDVTLDGFVNHEDYNLMQSRYNQDGSSFETFAHIASRMNKSCVEILCSGDVNGDLKVNDADYQIIQTYFNQDEVFYGQGDLNRDGSVDIEDLGIFGSNFGKSCSKE